MVACSREAATTLRDKSFRLGSNTWRIPDSSISTLIGFTSTRSPCDLPRQTARRHGADIPQSETLIVLKMTPLACWWNCRLSMLSPHRCQNSQHASRPALSRSGSLRRSVELLEFGKETIEAEVCTYHLLPALRKFFRKCGSCNMRRIASVRAAILRWTSKPFTRP